MGVPTTLRGISATAGSNSPAGTDVIGSTADDYLRGIQAVVRQYLASVASNIASATTTDLSTADGFWVTITGTTTITGLGTEQAGIWYGLIFNGALTFTHNGTSLILPGAANITTAAGDSCFAESLGSGSWKIHAFQKASGAPLNASQITNSLAGDVALNNISNFFTGPTVAQGTAGTWFASGTVTMIDSAGTARFVVKLWDGTTVIASAEGQAGAANQYCAVSVSGPITSPVGNIRISVKDVSSASGSIVFNATGESKDATLTAIRVG